MKKFHLYIHQKRNYTFFAVFWAEIIFLIMIIYFLYSLILPKTVITIAPAYQINEIAYNFRYITPDDITNYPYSESHIIIPLLKDTIYTTKVLSIDWEKVEFSSQQSKGKVRLVNTTKDNITLIRNTQLISDDGLLFTINREISIPKALWSGQAWYAYTDVTAKTHDANGKLMGARGNITQNTRLIVRNLRQSKYTKEVYAEVVENFNWWILTKSWSVVQSDIWFLQKKLYTYISQDKYWAVKKGINSDWSKVILPFEHLFTLSGCTYRGITSIENISTGWTLSWSLTCGITYPYITKEDIQKAIERYIEQRPSSIHNLISINTNSISFAQIISGSYNSLIIPTKINIIQWYDFKKDINGISNSIIDQVVWLPEDKAKNIILSYPEISNTTIKISPPRYRFVSNLKSRIFITIKYDNQKN
jgi:uncharacterized protein (DUF433 family)